MAATLSPPWNRQHLAWAGGAAGPVDLARTRPDGPRTGLGGRCRPVPGRFGRFLQTATNIRADGMYNAPRCDEQGG